MAKTEKIEVTVLGKTGEVAVKKEIDATFVETEEGYLVSAPFSVDTSSWDLVDEEKMTFGLTHGEQAAADIETLKRLVLTSNRLPLYVSIYNVVDDGKKIGTVRTNEIDLFFEGFDKDIEWSGLGLETLNDRLHMIATIKKTLSSYILTNIHPTYGAIILQPPRLEDGRLSLAYVDDFIHITFMSNFEDFKLEGINADIIQRQGQYLRDEFMESARRIIGRPVPLEFLHVNLYNLIGQMDISDIKARKLYYKNTIKQIINEWKEE